PMPFNCTDVAPVKLAPVTVTSVPGAPLVGEKLLMRGATVKALALVAVPPPVVTLMGPVVAPVGTVAVILVAELTLKVAVVTLNFTPVVPVKPLPVMVTLSPGAPPDGVKPVMAGAPLPVTVKLVVL